MKALLRGSGSPVGAGAHRSGSSVRVPNVDDAMASYVGRSRQRFPAANGTGSLAGSRGSMELTKNGKKRLVPIPADLMNKLLAVKAKARPSRLLFGTSFGKPDYHILDMLHSIAKRNWQGASWTGAGWAGAGWAGAGWAGAGWAGAGWAGAGWAGAGWAGEDYS